MPISGTHGDATGSHDDADDLDYRDRQRLRDVEYQQQIAEWLGKLTEPQRRRLEARGIIDADTSRRTRTPQPVAAADGDGTPLDPLALVADSRPAPGRGYGWRDELLDLGIAAGVVARVEVIMEREALRMAAQAVDSIIGRLGRSPLATALRRALGDNRQSLSAAAKDAGGTKHQIAVTEMRLRRRLRATVNDRC